MHSDKPVCANYSVTRVSSDKFCHQKLSQCKQVLKLRRVTKVDRIARRRREFLRFGVPVLQISYCKIVRKLLIFQTFSQVSNYKNHIMTKFLI